MSSPVEAAESDLAAALERHIGDYLSTYGAEHGDQPAAGDLYDRVLRSLATASVCPRVLTNSTDFFECHRCDFHLSKLSFNREIGNDL